MGFSASMDIKITDRAEGIHFQISLSRLEADRLTESKQIDVAPDSRIDLADVVETRKGRPGVTTNIARVELHIQE